MITEDLKRFFHAVGRLLHLMPMIGEAINTMVDGMTNKATQPTVGSLSPLGFSPPHHRPDVSKTAQEIPKASMFPSPQSLQSRKVADIVREAVRAKGPMTLAELIEHLQRTGSFAEIVERYGLKEARMRVQRSIYDLKKEGYLTHADSKSSTPWLPTAKFLSRYKRPLQPSMPKATLSNAGSTAPTLPAGNDGVEKQGESDVEAEVVKVG
jgi:hypothetical protein